MDGLEISKGDVARQLNKFTNDANGFYSNKDNLSPMVSITFFFAISSLYLFLQIFVIISATSLVEVDNVKTHKLYLISYCILILLGSFFINYNISKSLCPVDNINVYTLILNTVFPWLFIFGSIYGILLVFDTWHRPFSNTLGYLVIKLLGIESLFVNILAKPKGNDSDNEKILQAILNMKTNKSIFINEMDEEPVTFKEFFDQLTFAKIIENNDNDKYTKDITNIYKLIVIKNSVGRFVWFVLSGIIISTVTYNNIINSSCNQSKTSILKNYDNVSGE